MFKTIFLSIMLTAVVALAGPDMITLSVANASTNAAAIAADTAESASFIRGYIDSIVFDATITDVNTCTVKIATSGSAGTGAARTIYTAALSADGTYCPRLVPVGTTGSALSSTDTCKIPVFGDKLTFTAYNKTANTNFAVKAYVVISPAP